MYIPIDIKPENGCNIQDTENEKPGIMMWLRLVKTVVEKEAKIVREKKICITTW